VLRTFGCAAFSHQSEGKLEPRARKCVFLGYPEGVKGYRLWDRSQKGVKIIISRDVTFNEIDMPCLKDESDLVSEKPQESEEPEVEVERLSIHIPVTPSEVENDTQDQPTTEEVSSEDVEEEHPIDQDCLVDYQLTRDRERRPHRLPKRLGTDYSLAYASYQELVDKEPNTYDEAIKSENSKEWVKAMKEEMNSLYKNQTWELVPKPKDKSLVGCKWIYKVKEGTSGNEPIRFKARLVAKGFTQKEGVDYNEIFSPVVKYTTIRVMLALVAHFNWELEQLDVKTAFLHGDLEEKIYMSQPRGFEDRDKPNHVCYLKKSLYGLKQSPRQWYKRFDFYVHSIGFKRSEFDHCLYFQQHDNNCVFLLLYVDDMLLIGPNLKMINGIKITLDKEFDMKDLGNARKILGMEIERNRSNSCLFLHQSSYIMKILKKFGMHDCKPVSLPLASHFILSKEQSPANEEEKEYMNKIPYSNVIGSIMYLMVCTRPDLAHTVSTLSRFMSNLGPKHWEALKWLLRYLKGSCDIGLVYKHKTEGVKLKGFTDSDYAGDRDNRKSMSSYVFTLCNACISWKSQLQHIVVLSTTESEYIATIEAIKEALRFKSLLKELSVFSNDVIVY